MTSAILARKARAVRVWLLLVAALMLATLIVGGATRLTEAGLSIVEWRPVTGVLPPLDEAQWQAEFAKYQTIPQYRERKRAGQRRPSPCRARDITRVQQRPEKKQVAHHAVIELHGERILEKIAP